MQNTYKSERKTASKPIKRKKTFNSKLFVRILRILRNIVIAFFLSSILSVFIYKFVAVPYTPIMITKYLGNLGNENNRLKKKWVTLDKISHYLPEAAIAAEDCNYYEHDGFDFDAIQKAYESNKKSKNIKGASTISQQTAKNVFLWQGRSWIRKGFEVYFTFLIEKIWSKERIMEVYLNVIEMGDGIYGAEAASQYYFKKPASKLTQSEAAAIIAILPNPIKFKVIKPSNYTIKRKDWIIKEMNYIEYLKDKNNINQKE